MATMDPTDPAFSVAGWEAALVAERDRRAEERRLRDAGWRQELRTRHLPKDGAGLGPSYVSVPVPDPAPGAPRFVLVRRG